MGLNSRGFGIQISLVKRKIIPVTHKLLQKSEEERILPNLFLEASITLILKHYEDITRKLRPVFLIHIN